MVGDMAGFAAANYLRGIPFFQVPTTLIAQIDSSVGGKTGVNLPHGKNLVGAFHQPLRSSLTLKRLTTLPARELVAGWCETYQTGRSRQPNALQTNYGLSCRFLNQIPSVCFDGTGKTH